MRDQERRPTLLFSEAFRDELDICLQDPSVLLCGQLVAHGHSALTRGLEKKYSSQVMTYPVSEEVMNASAVGLALSGKKPIVVHERFDFLAWGIGPLVIQVPAWRNLGIPLPLIVVAIVGHGKGQGPEQCGEYRRFFNWRWDVRVMTKHSIPDFRFTEMPKLIVVPRQLYD